MLLLSALYGIYTVTLTELKTVSAQAKHSDAVNKSSSESIAKAQCRPGVSDGILKLMKIRLRGSTSLAVIDRLSPISH
jgi:hypothetical protein